MDIKEFIENFADQFDDTDISEIKPETVMRDLDEWSSMIGLSLLNMVDNEYGVQLTFDELKHAITVQNLFDIVEKKKPAESLLTSFSVLMAAHKGDIGYFVESAPAIDRLTEQSRVLIAEACTHAPLAEDIGREKIPRMLRQRVGQGLKIDIVAGKDFPNDLTGYDLVIHCGGCMFNRRFMLQREEQCRAQGVPMTNYGITIAHVKGILGKVSLP